MKQYAIRQDEYTVGALLSCYARAKQMDRVRDLEDQVTST